MYKGKQRAAVDFVMQKQLASSLVVVDNLIVKAARAKAQVKRGLEIESFEDLPLDVQRDIEMMSRAMAGVTREVASDKKYEVTYDIEKALRTFRAVNYQHVFPGRF